MDRHEVLKEIQKDEEIACVSDRWGITTYTIVKVVGKTATGSLKLEDGDLVQIKSNWSRDRNQYCIITDEILKRIEVQNKANELKEVIRNKSFLDLTIEQMDTILDIVKI